MKTKKEQNMEASESVPNFDYVEVVDINEEDEMQEIYL